MKRRRRRKEEEEAEEAQQGGGEETPRGDRDARLTSLSRTDGRAVAVAAISEISRACYATRWPGRAISARRASR